MATLSRLEPSISLDSVDLSLLYSDVIEEKRWLAAIKNEFVIY